MMPCNAAQSCQHFRFQPAAVFGRDGDSRGNLFQIRLSTQQPFQETEAYTVSTKKTKRLMYLFRVYESRTP
jgi:hypothetical protein